MGLKGFAVRLFISTLLPSGDLYLSLPHSRFKVTVCGEQDSVVSVNILFLLYCPIL